MLYKKPKSFFTYATLFIFIIALFSFLTFKNSSAEALTDYERAQLELQLKDLQAEADKLQKDLDGKVGERKGMEGELAIINTKIAQSKNKISQTTTQIKKISGDINVREQKIQTLGERIDKNKVYSINEAVDLLLGMKKATFDEKTHRLLNRCIYASVIAFNQRKEKR